MQLIIILGPPGIGKGSVSQILVLQHGFRHLSTGEMFRRAKTEMEKLNQGTLLGDDFVNDVVLKELKKYGKDDKIILDGYPRTKPQADFLSSHFAPDKIFLLTNVSDDLMIRRLGARLMCKAANHSFNEIYSPPKVAGICDFDGSELFKRPDDEAPIAKKRIDTYREQTRPLAEHYRTEGKVVEIDASVGAEEMVKQILRHLD